VRSKAIFILALAFATSFVSSIAPSPAFALTSSLEFKTLVDPTTSPQEILKLHFNRALAEHSYLYFFDTRDLKLFQAGLVIRARNFPGAGGELMVRARPLEPDDLDASWFEVYGMSCEMDATPLKSQSACSVRLPTATGAIDAVVTGAKPHQYIMKPDQEYFANDFGGYDGVARRVRTLGPVESWRWRVPNPAGWKVFAEYWLLPDGSEYIELSIRGLSSDQVKLEAALKKVIADTGVEQAPLTLNKTAAVLKTLTTIK
jgi:hypothetical protein